ncbi:MAG TPA: hypothetical protein VKT99_14175 [Xanthobacteraceae bacterium]|nr:hypothetical protein [Xanthobacteraceae bacterium]
MPSQRAHENIIHRAGKMADNPIDKSMLQAAGAPIVFAQFDCDEHQDALNKDMLPGAPDMPDGLVGIALSPPVVGFAPAARLDGPEIDPGHNGGIVRLASKGAKRWKVVKTIDDERAGSFIGHW